MRSPIPDPIARSYRLILAATGILFASAAPTYAQQLTGWAGSIRCELQAQAPGYSHQETQTWALTGAAPTVQGSVTAYPATWTVVGGGQHDRTTGTSTRRVAQWTANVAGVTAPIGFTLHALGRTFDVSKWHAQLTRGGGYTGTDQFFNNGALSSSQQLVATVYEWQFPKIEAATTETQLTGTNTTQVRTQIGPLQPYDALVTVTCTWSLARGSAPPSLPPSTMPPAGTASGGVTPPGTAPGGGATTNPPSQAGVPVAPPAPATTTPPSAPAPGSTVPATPPPPLSGATVVPIVPVLTSTLPTITLTPSSAPAGATNVLVTVTGFNTDFTADYGRTYATFQGEGWVFHPWFTVTSPTTGTMLLGGPLTEGPLGVSIQTGSTVIRVNGGFTVTPSPLANATVVPVIPALTANVSDLSTVIDGVTGRTRGEPFEFRARMRNLGPAPVTGAILTVTLPPSGYSITQMQCFGPQDGPPIRCPTITQPAYGLATPTLAPGEQFSVTINGTLTGDVGSSITFAMTGRAPAGAFDPDSTNNSESATVVIGP